MSNLRKLLLAALVLGCGLNALKAKAEGLTPLPPYKLHPLLYDVREVYPVGNCPTDDVGGWTLNPAITPSTRVYWAIITDAELRAYCPGTWVCAESRGESGFIYALMPPEMYPPFILLHEFCHTQGWEHGQWVGANWHLYPRSRP